MVFVWILVFVLACIATYVVFLVTWPVPTVRVSLRCFLHLIYRIEIIHPERIPREGGALLVSNHLSWMDGVLLFALPPRPMRMVATAPIAEKWWARWLSQATGIIPIRTAPKALQRAMDHARLALANGELVGLFSEGGISRTGQTLPFKPGMLQMLPDPPVPIIPIRISGIWGSVFSYSGGKFFWKWPTTWRRRIRFQVGPPVQGPREVWRIQRMVERMEVDAMQDKFTSGMILPRRFLRSCRRGWGGRLLADSLGQNATGGQTLLRTCVARRLLQRILSEDEQFVGILLPPCVAAAVMNAALPLMKRIPVNLNYTLSSDVLNECLRQCGIRHVLTSRRMMNRLDLSLDAELVYLEDLPGQVKRLDKITAFLQARLTPMSLLERAWGLKEIQAEDLLTVIFTSGSTGIPKGVMLTHDNVASNVEAIEQIIVLRDDDVLLGTMPFFHSYGFTATLWTVLAMDQVHGVYHPNPLEPKEVGRLCREHRVTIFMSTPTFLRSYLRRCPPEDLQSLEVVFAGSEKLPPALATAFEEKFGTRPQEAYGATELSPLVAANVPPDRSPLLPHQPTSRDGSVGHALPEVLLKIVDPDTGEEKPPGESGMLHVCGRNVMAGYLEQPERTQEVIQDGWYITGDIAKVDKDGFLFITGRLSRFSKIGGEMVPHLKVEEALAKALGAGEDEICVAVTGVPDEKKGERLVVFHTRPGHSSAELCQALKSDGLPNLWIPTEENYFVVESIPLLGIGKPDLKAIRDLALEKTGGTQPVAESPPVDAS